MPSRFIPGVPKFTGSLCKKQFRTPYDAILYNVLKPAGEQTSRSVLISADVERKDHTKQNITKYMEDHKIPLLNEYNIVESLDGTQYILFVVKMNYMDTELQKEQSEMYTYILKRYLQRLIISQVNCGDKHMKIERHVQNQNKSLPDMRAQRIGDYCCGDFLCSSDLGNVDWYIAEKIEPMWSEDGALMALVRPTKIDENFSSRLCESNLFMYPETPLLFSQSKRQKKESGTRVRFRRDKDNYILDEPVVQYNGKSYRTLTSTLLSGMISIHNFFSERNTINLYNGVGDFEIFANFLKEETQSTFSEYEKQLFEQFWGNVIINYDFNPIVTSARKELIDYIYWRGDEEVSEQPEEAPEPPKKVIKYHVVTDNDELYKQIEQTEFKSLYDIPSFTKIKKPDIRREKIVYIYTDRSEIGEVQDGENVFLYENGYMTKQKPESLWRKILRKFI